MTERRLALVVLISGALYFVLPGGMPTPMDIPTRISLGVGVCLLIKK